MSSPSEEYLRRAKVMLENPAMNCTDLMMLLTSRVNYELLSPDDEPSDLLAPLLQMEHVREKLIMLITELFERKWFEDAIAMPGSTSRELFLFALLQLARLAKPEGKLLEALQTLKVRRPEILNKSILDLSLMLCLERAIANSPQSRQEAAH